MNTKTTIKNTKTITIFSANYLPHIGGVENFTYHLSQALEAMNYHVIIVTNNVFNLTNHEFLKSGIEIYRVPCHSLLKGRLPLPRKNNEFNQLLGTIVKQKIDYILINTRFYPHSLIATKLAHQKQIVPIIIDHGSAYITLGNPIIDSVIKIYEHLITTALKRYPANYYGISQASLQWLSTFHINGKGIINNSIDADIFLNQASKRNFRKEFHLQNNDFVVCFVGRLVPEKGIVPLLKCAEYFLTSNPSIQFILAGEGPLKQFIVNKKLSNVHLTGAISSPDIAALLTQSNVFCLPSRSEGFCTSLMEASACYTASIITNVGGVAELIPSPDYGIIIPNAKRKSIIKAIEELATNPIKTKQIGKNVGHRVREEFSWKKSASKVLAACLEANR